MIIKKLLMGLGLAGVSILSLVGCPPNSGSGSSSEPPAAPSNLNATALSSSEVELTWTDNADNERGFIIKRRKPTWTTYTKVDTLYGADYTSYIDETVRGNTTYCYVVVAVNSAGESLPSNEKSVHTPMFTLFGGSSGDDGLFPSCGYLGIEPVIFVLLILLVRRGWLKLSGRSG